MKLVLLAVSVGACFDPIGSHTSELYKHYVLYHVDVCCIQFTLRLMGAR